MVKSEDNQIELTKGGNDTEDRIFLLSGSEAEKYFNDGNWHAFKGAFMGYYDPDGEDEEEFFDGDDEWLRMPGRYPADMEEYWELDPEDRDEEFDEDWMNGYAAIYYDGQYIDYEGNAVALESGVRPAFWIDLK